MSLAQKRLEQYWLASFVSVLLGYAIYGRAFANFYVGELLILVGMVLFIRSRRLFLLLSDPVLFIWLLFAIWGLIRTVPYIKVYRFDAIRDAVIWGYGLVAVMFVAFINSSDQLSYILNRYNRFLRWTLLCLPLIAILSYVLRSHIPTIPWSSGGAKFLDMKSADAGVQLSFAAAFVLLFPQNRTTGRLDGPSVRSIVSFLSWTAGVVFVLVRTRAGFVALILPLAVLSGLRAKTVGWKIWVAGFLVGTSLIMILASDVLSDRESGEDRTFNSEAVTKNLVSILGSAGQGSSQEGSKQFRLKWWKHIVSYTIYGPYFWTGRGFGINLAVLEGKGAADPEEAKLRSPHSGHMSILARMGVPGFALWIALNLTYFLRMWRGYSRSIKRHSRFWASLHLWILCCWLASILNMSFDVYLEGPQGGIWYWALIGLGVAVGRVQEFEWRNPVRKEIKGNSMPEVGQHVYS